MGDYPVKLSKFLADDEKNHRKMIDKDLELNFQLLGQQKKINDKLLNVYEYLTENKTYFLDPILGDDNNDGASATPLKTIQKYIDLCPFNLNGFSYDAFAYKGTYAEAVVIPVKVGGKISLTALDVMTWKANYNTNYSPGGDPFCFVNSQFTTISLSATFGLNINFLSTEDTLIPGGSGAEASGQVLCFNDGGIIDMFACTFGKTATETNISIMSNFGTIKMNYCSDGNIPCDIFLNNAPGLAYLSNLSISPINITGSGIFIFEGTDLTIEKKSYDNAINCSFSNGTITNLTTSLLTANVSTTNATITNITIGNVTGSVTFQTNQVLKWNTDLSLTAIPNDDAFHTLLLDRNVVQEGNRLQIKNSDLTANSSRAMAVLDVVNTSAKGSFVAYGTNYNASSYAGFIKVSANIGNGLILRASDPAGIVKILSGGDADSNERMRFTADGLIGINTSAPSSLLHINNTTNSANAVNIINNSQNTGLYISQNNALGAGNYGLAVITSSSHNTPATDLVRIANYNPSASNIALRINTSSQNSAILIQKFGGDSNYAVDLNNVANSANAIYGIGFNIVNSGAGLEYAMRFDGSEAVAAAVGGSQDKKIRVKVGGTDYYIPLYTA